MGREMPDRITSVRTYFEDRFYNMYESGSAYFHLRKDQQAVFGMVFGIAGMFMSYLSATSLVNTISIGSILMLGIGLASMVFARHSIKSGFSR